MISRGELTLWSVDDVDSGRIPADRSDTLKVVVEWARDFLNRTHPDLGRKGPVCPYTRHSMEGGLFHVACPGDCGNGADIEAAIAGYRDWFTEIAEDLPPDDRLYLTLLVALPAFDATDPAPLDALQLRLKNRFVTSGLMIGQFHPACAQAGIWNPAFRPLRAPLPLLAIRHMVPFDLPFLTDTRSHFAAYLTRFAPGVPERMRARIAALVPGPG